MRCSRPFNIMHWTGFAFLFWQMVIRSLTTRFSYKNFPKPILTCTTCQSVAGAWLTKSVVGAWLTLQEKKGGRSVCELSGDCGGTTIATQLPLLLALWFDHWLSLFGLGQRAKLRIIWEWKNMKNIWFFILKLRLADHVLQNFRGGASKFSKRGPKIVS